MDNQRIILFLRIVRITLMALPFAALGFLGFRFFTPDGRMIIRYEVEPNRTSSIVTDFASKEPYRLIGETVNELGKDYFQLITVDPVYFNIPALRNWQKATVKMYYQNPDSQPMVNLGVQGSGAGYTFRPLLNYDPRLEAVKPYWKRVERDSMVLWQKDPGQYHAYREHLDRIATDLFEEELRSIPDGGRRLSAPERKKIEEKVRREAEKELVNFDYGSVAAAPLPYQTVNDFLANPPDARGIGLFNFDWSAFSRISEYRRASKRTEITKSLRGSHTIVFNIAEINRHKDDDEISVSVVHAGSSILTEKIPDDGIHTASGKILSERQYRLKIDAPKEGIYTIELDTTDDTFFASFDTQQHLFFFQDALYLAENEE